MGDRRLFTASERSRVVVLACALAAKSGTAMLIEQVKGVCYENIVRLLTDTIFVVYTIKYADAPLYFTAALLYDMHTQE